MDMMIWRMISATRAPWCSARRDVVSFSMPMTKPLAESVLVWEEVWKKTPYVPQLLLTEPSLPAMTVFFWMPVDKESPLSWGIDIFPRRFL